MPVLLLPTLRCGDICGLISQAVRFAFGRLHASAITLLFIDPRRRRSRWLPLCREREVWGGFWNNSRTLPMDEVKRLIRNVSKDHEGLFRRLAK